MCCCCYVLLGAQKDTSDREVGTRHGGETRKTKKSFHIRRRTTFERIKFLSTKMEQMALLLQSLLTCRTGWTM